MSPGAAMQDLDRYAGQSERFERGEGASSLAWLRPVRRKALDRFLARGFPTSRDEAWKYTSVASLAGVPFLPAPPDPSGLSPARLDRLLFGNLGGLRLVFVDGRFAPGLSSPLPEIPGVTLGSLAEASPAFLEPHLARLADSGRHPFTALNTAFLLDGAFLRLGPGRALEAPVHLVFAATAAAGPTLSHPRALLVAEEGSSATVIETYLGLGQAPSLTNAVTEVAAAPGSSLRHLRIQAEGAEAFHVGMFHARQERDSTLALQAASLGASLSRHETHVALAGPGASCDLQGLYLGTGRQHVDHLTDVDHAVPRCSSRQRYKGILHGSARGVFLGRILVRPDAQKTEAHQTSQNLLLSDQAEVDAKPQLEIHADDVVCTHGATIGRLDETAVFYLRSRGVGPESARSLLTYGFAEDIVQRIPVEAARDQLTTHLCAWLSRHLGGGIPR